MNPHRGSVLLSFILLFCIQAAPCLAEIFRVRGPIAYLTDVEGIGGKLEEFFRESSAFFQDANGVFHLKPGATFIYGGDPIDRGPNDREVVRTLLRLAEESNVPGQQPSVLWNGGNRASNKLNAAWMLTPEALAKRPARPNYPEMLRRALIQDAIDDERLTAADREAKISVLNALSRASLLARHDTPVNRGKALLVERFNAVRKFHFRKVELERENPGKTISDEQVLSSMVDDFKPGGLMRRYLDAAYPILQFKGNYGRDYFFLHAAISDEGFKQVPSDTVPRQYFPVATVEQWVRGHQRFFHDQLARFFKVFDSSSIASAYRARGEMPAQPLIDYNNRSGNRSPDYSRTADANNNFLFPGPGVMEDPELARAYVVGGHTPSGPIGSSGRHGDQRTFRLDNSYMSNEREGAHMVGATFLDDADGTVSIFSTLAQKDADGKPLKVRFSVSDRHRSPIGHRTPDGDLIVGQLAPESQVPGAPDKRYVLFHYEPGFEEVISFASLDELHSRHLSEPLPPSSGGAIARFDPAFACLQRLRSIAE